MKWHVLENQLWDSQTSILRVMLGPGHKLWEEKILKITPEAKSFMVRQYFNRQMLNSRVNFMKWYLKHMEIKVRYNVIPEMGGKSKSYEMLIPIYEKLVVVHDKFLDKD